MVWVSEETVFPVSMARLWRVLELHLDDGAVGKIHPFIISSQRIGEGEGGWVFERVWRRFGRTFGVTTKYEMTPVQRFRWEVTASTGGLAPGSYIENTYSEVGEGKTKIVSKGELKLRGVPGFLQGWVVRRGLDQSDDEDLRYLLSQT